MLPSIASWSGALPHASKLWASREVTHSANTATRIRINPRAGSRRSNSELPGVTESDAPTERQSPDASGSAAKRNTATGRGTPVATKPTIEATISQITMVRMETLGPSEQSAVPLPRASGAVPSPVSRLPATKSHKEKKNEGPASNTMTAPRSATDPPSI